MRAYAKQSGAVDDMKVCLLRNRTNTPFITSDDPAVLTNRWYFQDTRARGLSFGLSSSGNIFLLPLSPHCLCLGYDGDVYSVPHQRGLVNIRNLSDIRRLNQHQYLNCRANIFFRNPAHADIVREGYAEAMNRRPEIRHRINYAIVDGEEDGATRYRVIEPTGNEGHEQALVISETIHPRPASWPRQLRWRNRGDVYTNGSGVGYIRRSWVRNDVKVPFRREHAHT